MAKGHKYASERAVKEFNEYVRKINQDLSELQHYDPDAVSLERWVGEFSELDPKKKWNANTVRQMAKQAKRIYESGQLSWDTEQRSKASTIETLREDYGYDFINGRNFSAFMHFLDDARARGLASIYSSEQMIEAYQQMREKGLTKRQIQENINRWANKAIRYDKEGKLIEREETPPLKVVRTRKEYGLKSAIKERHPRTKRIKRR